MARRRRCPKGSKWVGFCARQKPKRGSKSRKGGGCPRGKIRVRFKSGRKWVSFCARRRAVR